MSASLFCFCVRNILRIFYQSDWTFYSNRKKCKIDLKLMEVPRDGRMCKVSEKNFLCTHFA